MMPRRRSLRRPDMRRAVILFPSGLTLGNLFFGIFAIIAASRGQFVQAGVFVLLGGACDALDGQVARATNAGTQFGEELDSLVDAITFGLAPGLIMYFAVLNRDNWDWISVFLFSACAVMRLARFNIEQAGTAKTYFQGLPSPAAGITLASYYWFSQSWLYNYGAIADLPWHVLLRFLMAALAFLMISNIPYPVFPRTGFRSLRAIASTLLLVGSLGLLASKRLEFFFPFALCYVAWGPLRWMFSGMFERRQPTIPYDLSEGEDDEDEEDDVVGPIDSQVHASRQSEREPRPSRVERERGRRERPERTERSERPERGERPARTERPERTPAARTERAPKSEPAAARSEREPRTDAEREARRERREKRDKRDKRRERETRSASASDTPAVETAPESGVGAITLGAPVESAGAPVLSVVRGESDGATASEGEPERATAEGGSTRKRKRRRRRGQRERATGDTSESSDATDASDAGDASDADDAMDGGEFSEAYDAEPESPRRPAAVDLGEPSAPVAPSLPPASTSPPPQSSASAEPAPSAPPPPPSQPDE
jgi:CDP-diacylglycerol--serine O-phosphatidyltransferase